ncbi:hypothetical protein LEP1GSC037_0369 [Leptospira interrogans str. 2006001854]|uniref:Uncharacterized protein n=1 Tax=Leptospira interrogans str. 2006001854 TaxID=1001590 RepID=M6GMT4_LEPIR|nr:hypothetical protein LEP1GSC037_0369 [Leptospira interrogans str. 2006001854]
MKLRILNITIWNLFVFWILNCSIGSARDACRNNLHASDSAHNCDYFGLGMYGNSNNNNNAETFEKRQAFTSFLLLECLEYYEKLNECDAAEKRYIPSVYSKK